MARVHARIAIRFRVARETLVLLLPRPRDALTDGERVFFRALTRDITVFDRRHFDMQINPVQQRAGYPLTITLHLDRAATAFAFQVAEVSTRAGIHRRHQHELAWES